MQDFAKDTYAVDGVALSYFKSVMERLYNVDTHRLGADEARTLANGMHTHLTARVFDFGE